MAEKLKLNPHRPTRNLSNQNISHHGWSSLVHFGEWIIGRGTWRKSTETIEKYVNSGTIGRRVNVYQYSKDMITLVIMYYNIITFKNYHSPKRFQWYNLLFQKDYLSIEILIFLLQRLLIRCPQIIHFRIMHQLYFLFLSYELLHYLLYFPFILFTDLLRFWECSHRDCLYLKPRCL